MFKTLNAEQIHFAISENLRSGMSHIDALCLYARTNDMEVEALAEIVKRSPIIKQKLFEEASVLNMVKIDKTSMTNIDESI